MDNSDLFLDNFISLNIVLFVRVVVDEIQVKIRPLGDKVLAQCLPPIVVIIDTHLLITVSSVGKLNLVLAGQLALVIESHSHSGELKICNAKNMVYCGLTLISEPY